jgi:hypothetical protein
MKKLLAAFSALALAAFAFADGSAPASTQNTEIYGQTWFEYGYSEKQASTLAADKATSNFGSFTFGAPNGDKVRVGIRESILPNLKAQLELDVVTMDLKQANVAYVPMDGLTIKAGRMNKLFAQVNSAIYQKRWQGVNTVYDFGSGYVGFGVGNEIDQKYPTVYPYGTKDSLTYASLQPYTKFEPAVAYRVFNDKDLKLEVGANGEFGFAKSDIPTSSATSKDGTAKITAANQQNIKTLTSSVDGYVCLYASGLSASAELTYLNLEQSNKNQDDAYTDGYDVWKRPTFFGQLAYKMGNVTPTVTYVWDTNWTKNDSTVNFEAPCTIANGVVINPLFSYAIAGYNYNDNVYYANSDRHDWTLGLRVDYKFSSKF